MKIDIVVLRRMGIIYLFLPVLIFLMGWLRIELSVPCVLLTLVALYRGWREDSSGEVLPVAGFDGTVLRLHVWGLLLMTCVVIVWCAICGQGGLVVQKFDWCARNALFRDLITHRWPVMYPQTDGMLSYYVGHWLPAGWVGGLVLRFGGTEEIAWRIGYWVLFAWTALGVLLTWLVLLVALRVNGSVGGLCAFMAVFVLFGGMDVIGYTFRQIELWMAGISASKPLWVNMDGHWSHRAVLHWGRGFQFSSMTTLLSWVFNQTVAPWLATALVAVDRRIDCLGLYLFPLLVCAPFPFAGLASVLLIVWLVGIFRSSRPARAFCSAFSVVNVLSFCSVAIPSALYLTTNMNSGTIDLLYTWDLITPFKYSLFLMLEIGFFVLYLRKSESRNPWFIACLVVLVTFPCIYIGRSRDFGMRSTIPPLFLLCVWVVRELLVSKRGRWIWVVLAIGAVGPICSMVATVQQTHDAWGTTVKKRSMYKIWPDFWRLRDRGTYDRKREDLEKIRKWYVYYGQHPSESFFFKYCARR